MTSSQSLALTKIAYIQYKTILCRHFQSKKGCTYGDKCKFAHGEKELRKIDNNFIKYKIVKCKYWEKTGYCPYGINCTFAHGEKEVRETEKNIHLFSLNDYNENDNINNINIFLNVNKDKENNISTRLSKNELILTFKTKKNDSTIHIIGNFGYFKNYPNFPNTQNNLNMQNLKSFYKREFHKFELFLYEECDDIKENDNKNINEDYKNNNEKQSTEINAQINVKDKTNKYIKLIKLYDFKYCFEKKGYHKIKLVIKDKIKDLSGMFSGCDHLVKIEGNLDTSECENFSYMFYKCSSLNDINSLKNWKVSKILSFDSMFSKCTSLSDISALKNWNTSGCLNFFGMFRDCKILSDLSPLNSWDFSKGFCFDTAFSHCENLSSIKSFRKWKGFGEGRAKGVFLEDFLKDDDGDREKVE